jgi:sugar/nucleoside kinase (ribokinase family)
MQAVVLGNITLDVLCYPVEEVPRFESITFDQSVVSPGGCGSNVAVGLSALGVSTALVGWIGTDTAAGMITHTWDLVGLDYHYVHQDAELQTAVSVGLIDKQCQPRFIHTPGANSLLTADDLKVSELSKQGVRAIHVAGYFVLPGLLNDHLQEPLCEAKSRGILTSLDVVRSPNMDQPQFLWPLMPYLDIFLCNAYEASHLSEENDPVEAARKLRSYGVDIVIVKLGAEGCWIEGAGISQQVPGLPVEIVDTTGAGDAFAAGLIASLLNESDLISACHSANQAGALVAADYGCISAWLNQ